MDWNDIRINSNMKEKQPVIIKQERLKKDTDHPERHPSNFRNEKVKLMSQEEIAEWWEKEKFKVNTLNLGS